MKPAAFRLAAALLLSPLAALAADAPPADARPLSQILAGVETRADFAHVDEVDWDSDGYWMVEYVTKAGAKVKLRLDPKTGAERAR